MTRKSFKVARGLRLGGAITLTGCFFSAWCGNYALAQITPDGTLGTEPSVVTPNVNINGGLADRIDGGVTRGANLFHSFTQFNVGDGQRVYFANPVGVENILTRVTGANISNIQGTLGVTGGNANLFLINPNGIIFGENARLDVGGSFVATTANAIGFDNQGFFSASTPESPSLLTVNPSAFFFNQINAKRIENRSIVPAGVNLVGDSGEVGLDVNTNNLQLNFPQAIARADVSLTNAAFVTTSGENGGEIQVWGRQVTLTQGSQIESNTVGSSSGGNLTVDASESVQVIGESVDGLRSGLFVETQGTGNAGNLIITTPVFQILEGAKVSTTTRGAGNGGMLTVIAPELVQVSGFSRSGNFGSDLFAQAGEEATGDAGELTIRTQRLLVQDGGQIGVSTFGVGNGGNLTITASELVQVSGFSGIFADTLSTGNAGELRITTGRLQLEDGGQVAASTWGAGNGGRLTVTASELVQARGTAFNFFPSGLFVSTLGEGDAGNLTINTSVLLIQDGAQISSASNSDSTGNGGSLTINVSEFMELSGSESGLFTQSAGVGNAGDLMIRTPSLTVQDSAISAATLFGDAGNIEIHSDQLLIQGEAIVGTSSLGSGKGGNLTVFASESIQLTGSVLFSGTRGTGNAGNLTIHTPQLIVEDRARITADTALGSGNAGNVDIHTNQLLLRSGGVIASGTFGEGNGGKLTVNATGSVQVVGDGTFPTPSGLFTETQGSGNAQDLTINTPVLIIQDGAQIRAGTGLGSSGEGGDLLVTATELVQLIGFTTTANGQFPSGLFTQTRGTGNAGNLTISTPRLIVQDGALASAETFDEGVGGQLTVNVTELVQVIGTSTGGELRSSLSTETRGTGDAGNLTINAPLLVVRDGAWVSAATTQEGAGGNITVTANALEATNGGQLRTTTEGSKDAGDIDLIIHNSLFIAGVNSGLFANTEEGSSGNGGSIFINNPKTVLIQDGARIAVDSRGSGEGGDIEIQAGSLTLENEARLLAETASNTGGDITLQLQDLLLLRNQSKISTTAGTVQAGGDGGNITIDTDFIVAVPKEDSDITANAFQGRGGNINITATGIYGIDFRPRLTPLSDITASSETGIDGIVDINTSGIDPVRGIVNLPAEPTTSEVAQDCQSSGGKTSGSFINTGRGGLPTNPYEPLTGNEILADVQLPTQWTSSSAGTASPSTLPQTTAKRLVEAQGWIINENGEVVLVAEVPSMSAPWNCRLH